MDPSDVVQEALADAARKLGEYLRDRPLPFYPWLHRLAAERLSQAHRRHLKVQARAVDRERPGGSPLDDESAHQLAERLAGRDREILVMYYLDGSTFAEIASILDITEGAAKVRHFRALDRLRKLMEPSDGEGRSR